MLRNRRGQNTAEYAVLIGLIVAAAIAMQTYVKRGLQARIKEAADHVPMEKDVGGRELSFTEGGQYEPYYFVSGFRTKRASEQTEELRVGGGVTRETTIDDSKRAGKQKFLDPTANKNEVESHAE